MTTTKRTTRKTRPSEIKKAYFNWLWRKIDDKRENSAFKEFVYNLHNIEFYSILPNDDNRAMDGVLLRGYFEEAKSVWAYDINILEKPCTVFEMLVALSDRMDFILFDIEIGKERCPQWFWMFIDNMKLEKYGSDDPESTRKRKYNHLKIRKFLQREYKENGEGGLFPLKYSEKDQRKVEIWYQMMAYISENYS